MIGVADLRQAVEDAVGWEQACRRLGVPEAVAWYREQASLKDVLKALCDLAIAEPRLQSILIGGPIPNTPGLSPLSDNGAEYAVRGGMSHAIAVARQIDEHARDTEAGLDILDFGCGTGRLLRPLTRYRPRDRYWGAEVNPAALDWLAEALPFARYLPLEPTPPCPAEAASFDVVYAWSIFTHFSESAHKAWLAELYRILRPGGVLIVTIHAEARLEKYAEEERYAKMLARNDISFTQWRAVYRERGFAFLKVYDDTASDVGADPEQFGNAFIAHDYVRATWADFGFDVLTIEPEVIPNWQDLVALRKRAY